MKDRIKNLRKSPLFAMSKGSMELFHSNFWRWLIVEVDKEFATAFIKDNGFDYKSIKNVEREKKHTDILISVGDKNIVIENKIKTLPVDSQLEKYKENLTNTFWFGICVIPCDFTNDLNIEKWSLITYEKILKGIENINHKNKEKLLNKKDINGEFCYTLINEYVEMTRNVIKIINSRHDIISKRLVTSSDVIDINSLGLADIIKKINGCELMNFLKCNLSPLYPENEYYYQCGFNHKKNTISIRKKIKTNDGGYILVGPQLEEKSFRRMIHITNRTFDIKKEKKDKDLLYESLKGVYFDKSEDSSKFNYPIVKNENKHYNEYNGIYEDIEHNLPKKDYIAIYRYYKIKETNFEEILKLFKEELKYVNEEVDYKALISKIKQK